MADHTSYPQQIDNWGPTVETGRLCIDKKGRVRRLRVKDGKAVIVGRPITNPAILAQIKRPD